METVSDWVLSLLSTNPNFATLITIVGILRLTIPPAMALVRAFVRATPTDKDEEFVERVFASKAWNSFVKLVEWLSSVQLPEASENPRAKIETAVKAK